jgi:hypothetical protein
VNFLPENDPNRAGSTLSPPEGGVSVVESIYINVSYALLPPVCLMKPDPTPAQREREKEREGWRKG